MVKGDGWKALVRAQAIRTGTFRTIAPKTWLKVDGRRPHQPTGITQKKNRKKKAKNLGSVSSPISDCKIRKQR